MTGPAPFWNEYLGVTAWVTAMWWAVALVALGGTIARGVRRRRRRRERERRRQAGRVAAAERRAAAKEARRMGKQQ